MSVDKRRVEELAYQIWESEGRPHGHDSRHWDMARKLAEAEADSGKKATIPKPRKPKAAPLKDVSSEASKKVPAKPKTDKAAKPAKPKASESPAKPTASTKNSDSSTTPAAAPAPAKKPAARKPAARKPSPGTSGVGAGSSKS
ncbi:DUF2934 domain-containing protein [Pseudomonas matsuisoli]|uniref:DUF2934 domain-containing protein n=1 Tax=Pseudomonas matsuisoli TaxID=1515666 RepID=A0A917PPQ3_9PSED|nr:DUF2934 domain-containing protein [Pseudomonas matsuisoli]GGJ86244.1 hypothetical protein GCM10009304_10400 [Pseudomonas matsuisoli]